jgi:small redox-active disulfide protein 2
VSVKLQILGMGCAKCVKLTAVAETAAKDLGLDYEVEKVTDPEEFVRLGVMVTPALVVDGKVKSMGQIPTAAQMKKLLEAP